MLPEITRRPSLSEQATELLRAAILSGELAPGAHLVETRLASDFQISRGPIREALKQLAADGLVEIRPGRGAFVIDPSANEMQDMIVLRAMLNGMAARYVAASGNPELFGRLDKALDGMRAGAERRDEKAFFDAHWAFYETIFQATNAVLIKAWSSLHGLFDLYVRRVGRPYLPLDTLLCYHERLVEILRDGDPGEAEAVLRSQTLIVGFRILERAIPPELRAYVTREILDDGVVITVHSEPDTGRIGTKPAAMAQERQQ